MEIIKTHLKHKIDIKNYFEARVCFLDIETTGLSRKYHRIYLVGLLYEEGPGSWVLKQYFAQREEEEKDIISRLFKDLEAFSKVITYNGQSFDLPFLDTRARILGLPARPGGPRSFDLYRLVRENRQYLNLKDLKLKSLEEYLGYYREDEYSGYDCIAFYRDYVKTGDRDLRSRLLIHNQEDLVHMLDVMEILDRLDQLKSIVLDGKKFTLEKIDLPAGKGPTRLQIQGTIEPGLDLDLINYNPSYDFRTLNKDSFSLSIDSFKGYIDRELLGRVLDLGFLGRDLTSKNPSGRLDQGLLVIEVEGRLLVDNIKEALRLIVEDLME